MAMASLDVHLHELEDRWLPPVCARCGASGRYRRAKTIIWSPWWVPLVVVLTGFVFFIPYVRLVFGYLAGGSDTNRRATMHLPFCARHRNHWRWRSWPLAGLVILSFGLIGCGVAIEIQLQPANKMGFLLIGFGILGLILWAPLTILVPLTGIRIKDLSGSAVTLTGLDEEFCVAVAKRRRRKTSSKEPFEMSEYDERLRRRRQGRFD
jgi:hypothetical protein